LERGLGFAHDGDRAAAYAFALWDRRERRLVLGRDRFGEKPLYYGWVGAELTRRSFSGASSRLLLAFPRFTNPANRDALAIRAYIRNQEKEDQRLEQLNLWR
jgi:asparagine synthetase B (glutamine-hydrolysing)